MLAARYAPSASGRDPGPGCRGSFAESPQNLPRLVQKVAPTPIKGCYFWGRGSENRTFWALFALKTQLLLSTPSPNYTVQLIWVRPCFMWNSIALAPQEHTPALTLGASQLTLVGPLTQKWHSQSPSNSLYPCVF